MLSPNLDVKISLRVFLLHLKDLSEPNSVWCYASSNPTLDDGHVRKKGLRRYEHFNCLDRKESFISTDIEGQFPCLGISMISREDGWYVPLKVD